MLKFSFLCLPDHLFLKSSIGGSSPCGELVLALAGIAVGIHLLGPGWGHLARSLDDLLQGINSFAGNAFLVKFIGFKLNN